MSTPSTHMLPRSAELARLDEIEADRLEAVEARYRGVCDRLPPAKREEIEAGLKEMRRLATRENPERLWPAGKLAARLGVTPRALNEAARKGWQCQGYDVSAWAVRHDSGRLKGYRVPAGVRLPRVNPKPNKAMQQRAARFERVVQLFERAEKAGKFAGKKEAAHAVREELRRLGQLVGADYDAEISAEVAEPHANTQAAWQAFVDSGDLARIVGRSADKAVAGQRRSNVQAYPVLVETDDGDQWRIFRPEKGVKDYDYASYDNAFKAANRYNEKHDLPRLTGEDRAYFRNPQAATQGSADTTVLELSLEELHADPARFQPREDAYSEASVERLVDDFDRRQLDPARVWKDPDDGKWYVLAGHSRREAQRRRRAAGAPDSSSLPAIPFEGTESEAIAFAHTENDKGTALTNAERAAYVRQLRDGTDAEGNPLLTLAEIQKEAKKLYGRDAATVIALSYLNPRGKALSTLRQLTGNASGEARDAETMAVWIGKLRRYHTAESSAAELTDSHENEIYSWLLDNYKTKGRRITSFIQFREYVERVIGRRSFMGAFDSSKPLNFADVPEKSRQALEVDRQIREARQALRQAQRALEEKRQWALETYDDISSEQLRIVLEEENDAVTIAQREVLRLEEEAGRARRTLAATERGLFDVLRESPALADCAPCAIVTENMQKGDPSAERGGIELRFPEDPGEDVLEGVREAGFFFYTPTDAPAFWAAKSTPARRAIAAKLDRTGQFARENPQAVIGSEEDLFELGPYVYLGRALEVDTTAGRYRSSATTDDFMFTDALGQNLLIVPPQYVEEATGLVYDVETENLFKLWNGYEADETDFRIRLPDAEILPAGKAEWILYESDKLVRPGDAPGRRHIYRHEFDPSQRPAMTFGKALLITNLEINQRGILN